MTKKFLNDTGLQHVFSIVTSFVKNYASPKTHNHDDVYAKSSHNHSASNITSGTLPVGRGGTGASSSKGAQYNIMNDILEGTANASDSDVFILKHHTPSATDGALLTRSAAQVWAWIKSKCDGLYQPRGSYASSSHTHTITNVSNLQSTLDSKASVSHTHSNATATASGFMSNTDKSKLDGVSTGANKTIVDASFSATSTNPVQNKVVKAALDAKASSSHTHTTSQVSGLDAALSGKAPTSHTHTIAQVTNLQSQLDSKVPVGRLINKKPLSADMTLTPADIGADAAGAATNALNSAKQYTDTVAAGKAAKSHVHDATNITTGTLSQDRLPVVPVAKGGTGKTTAVDSANALINSLSEDTATPTDNDYYVCQYAGGGTATTTYHRRKMSALWSWIKAKCDSLYQAKGSYAASSHSHSWSQITGKPSIPSALTYMPVGYVYISWSSTSPASMFGGTWAAITGRFPYFNAGTSTGGSNSHTLSINEMPSHNHSIHMRVGWGSGGGASETIFQTSSPTSGGNKWVESTNYTGGSAAHNNMPSYQTLYAWRRSA